MSSLPPGTDLCSIPVGTPPAGQTTNLVDPVDLSVPTIVVSSILTAFSIIFVAGRLRMNWRTLKLADYLTILGFVLSSSYTGVVIALRKYSRHAWDLPVCWYQEDYIWKLLFAQNLLLGITQFAVKVAILVLYFQIFAVNNKMRYAIQAGILFCVLIYFPTHAVLVITYMVPRSGESWSDLATDGRPGKLTYYAPVHGIGSILIDIYIFILPLPILRKLNVSRKRRLRLVTVFVTALLGVISSGFSAYWRILLTVSKSADQTWSEGQLFIWIIAEHDVALVVGCMPAFATFIKVHVANSTFVESIRTKVVKSSRNNSDSISEPGNPQKIEPANAGRRHRAYYYELDDSLLHTQTSIAAAPLKTGTQFQTGPEALHGITRTTAFSQELSDNPDGVR